MPPFHTLKSESEEHVMTRPTKAVRQISCIVAISISIGSARAAIPSAPDLPSQKQYLAKLAEFNLRGCLAIYKTTGKHDEKWDKEAIQFITEAINRPSPQKDLEPLGALEHRGHDLFAKGCDDGLVQYLYGMIQSDENHDADAEHSLRTACDSMHAQGYPANLQARAASEVCTIMAGAGRNGEIKPYADIVAAGTGEMFKTHLFNNTGQRELLIGELAQTGKYLDYAQRQAIWKAAAAVGDADPVAVLYLDGEFRTKQAWHYRGGGFTNTVTPEGWEGFATELKKAEACYSKAWEMDKSIPNIPTAMISIAMGSSGVEEMRLWFDRAVAARFDYPEAYHDFIFGILPRWHGNREMLLSFANECLETHRFDTSVPLHYFEILRWVQTECDHGDTSFWREPEIYARAKESFEKSIAAGGAAGREADVRGHEAAFAVRCAQWDDARRAIEKGFQIDLQTATDFGLSEELVKSAAFAYSGPGSEPALKGREQAIHGEKKAAIESYHAAIAAQNDPLAKHFLKGRAQILQWEVDFAAGAEVAIKADKELSGFKIAFGKWTADDDGGLVGSAVDPFLQISCEADFGKDWDMTADVDYIHTGADWSSTGLTVSPPGYTSYTGFNLNRQKQNITVHIMNHGEMETNPAPAADHNVMTLKRRGDTIKAIVNGKQVYEGDPFNFVARRDIGFGGWPNSPGDSYRYRNVKIKKAID